MMIPVEMPSEGSFLLLIGVWAMLVAAFAVVDERAMNRLLRTFRVRTAALFATWVAAAVIFGFRHG